MDNIILDSNEIMLRAKNNYGDYTSAEELTENIWKASRKVLEDWLDLNSVKTIEAAEEELN